MKLIIDIPEDVRVAITRMGLLRISNEMQKKVDKAIQRGTPIPDNATNGDVIKVMFPFFDIKIYEHKGYAMVFYDDFYTTYPLRWWNAPYQKGGK